MKNLNSKIHRDIQLRSLLNTQLDNQLHRQIRRQLDRQLDWELGIGINSQIITQMKDEKS